MRVALLGPDSVLVWTKKGNRKEHQEERTNKQLERMNSKTELLAVVGISRPAQVYDIQSK
jgi:hypothetical protein